MSGGRQNVDTPSFKLRLFMADEEPNSVMARENLRSMTDRHLTASQVDVEITDVFKDYRAALENNILVTPALIASGPGGDVVILGNLRDTGKVLAALRRAGLQTPVPGSKP